MNARETITIFLEFLQSKELKIIHTPTLSSPTEKGTQYLIDDFILYLNTRKE